MFMIFGYVYIYIYKTMYCVSVILSINKPWRVEKKTRLGRYQPTRHRKNRVLWEKCGEKKIIGIISYFFSFRVHYRGYYIYIFI